MVGAFAWPGAIFLIFWNFRKKLAELLPLLILKYKDWQISFGLDKAEEEAKRLPETDEEKPTEQQEQKTARETLAKLAPRASIMQARADIEKSVDRFAEAVGLSMTAVRSPNFSRRVRELGKNRLIDQSTVRLLNELRQIGNAATHNMSEPTEEEALRYRDLADRIVRQFNIASAAAGMPPPGPVEGAP
jgi:hypothetical protein